MWKAELIGGWLPDFGIRQLATDPRPVSVSATGETLEAVLLDRQDSFSFWSSQSVVRPPTQGRGSGIQHPASNSPNMHAPCARFPTPRH